MEGAVHTGLDSQNRHLSLTQAPLGTWEERRMTGKPRLREACVMRRRLRSSATSARPCSTSRKIRICRLSMPSCATAPRSSDIAEVEDGLMHARQDHLRMSHICLGIDPGVCRCPTWTGRLACFAQVDIAIDMHLIRRWKSESNRTGTFAVYRSGCIAGAAVVPLTSAQGNPVQRVQACF